LIIYVQDDIMSAREPTRLRDWRTVNVDLEALLRDIMSAYESEGACSLLTSDELDRDEITILCRENAERWFGYGKTAGEIFV
jgi:hypothetical protein